MDIGIGVGVVCGPLSTLLEQGVVWIEDTLAYQLKPFLEKAALVDALLVVELYCEFLLPALYLNVFELLERIRKDLIPSNLNINLILTSLLVTFTQVLLDAEAP